MDTVVAVAVRLVNTLTVGEARGRSYAPPSGDDLPAAVTAALRGARRETRHVTPDEAAEFGNVARALRAVFDAVAHGRLDQAARGGYGLLPVTRARARLVPARGAR